jgi:hypothetical protein
MGWLTLAAHHPQPPPQPRRGVLCRADLRRLPFIQPWPAGPTLRGRGAGSPARFQPLRGKQLVVT